MRFVRACLDGLLLRCPRCHKGRLFPRLFTYTMARQCPRCALHFEPDTGEVTGGMAVNMVLTSILGTALAIYGVAFTRIPTVTIAVALALGMLLFGLWFHRHARGLWVGVLYATGALLPTSGSSDPARAVRSLTGARPPRINPDAARRRRA